MLPLSDKVGSGRAAALAATVRRGRFMKQTMHVQRSVCCGAVALLATLLPPGASAAGKPVYKDRRYLIHATNL
jgi:hypothetical protein